MGAGLAYTPGLPLHLTTVLWPSSGACTVAPALSPRGDTPFQLGQLQGGTLEPRHGHWRDQHCPTSAPREQDYPWAGQGWAG